MQINTDGIHNLTYQAVDVAGRRSPPQSLTVRLDQTPPMVICSQAPPPTKLWVDQHRCNGQLHGHG